MDEYLKGVRNGKKLRMELMQHTTMQPILERLHNFTEQEYFCVSAV